MARQKLSEFRAKSMLLSGLNQPYSGIEIDTLNDTQAQLSSLQTDRHYVVKVDQAIKKRMKQGLVKLDLPAAAVSEAISEFADKGYRYCIVEPFLTHDASDERYLSLNHGRDGTTLHYSLQGGIDIEAVADGVKSSGVADEELQAAANELGVEAGFLQSLVTTFDNSYTSFLEVNPLVVNAKGVALLDVAAEVDAEAGHLADQYWSTDDFRAYRRPTEEEMLVAQLAATSGASLKFDLVNPDGAVFLLISGGGASIVVADEVSNNGFGKLLGNYGEYGGNSSEAETEAYTHALLSALLKSSAPQKILIIAGAVANFTNIRTTFGSIIKAIDTLGEQLTAQGVKVFVRRGGPHQTEALALMKDCLQRHNLLGAVHGPELPMAEIVTEALGELRERS